LRGNPRDDTLNYRRGLQSILFNKETEMSLITQYRSPSTEASLIKNVPIKYLIQARSEIKDAFPGRSVVARFRGPRYDSMALYCTKANARTFAVYVN
jgi:hypothetical protein